MEYTELAKYQHGGIQFPEYKSQYVDLGRTEIAQTLSDRYDKNKEYSDSLKRAIGSTETLELDEYTVQNLLGRVEGNLQGIVDSGAYEYGSMAIQDSITDYTTDQFVMDASKSYENRQAELEYLAKNRGKIYDFGNKPVIDPATGLAMRDPKTGEIITEHISKSYVTADQGIYQPLSEEILEGTAPDLMAGIADDPILLSSVASGLGLSPEEAALYLKSGKAVTGGKIRAVAEAVLPYYMDTKEGNQKMRALMQLKVNDLTGATHSTDEAAEVLLQELMSVAAPQRGSTLTYQTNILNKHILESDPAAAAFVPDTRESLMTRKFKFLNDEDFLGLFENGTLNQASSMADIAAAGATGAGIGGAAGTLLPGAGTLMGAVAGAGLAGTAQAWKNRADVFGDIPHEESLKRYRGALEKAGGDILKVEGNETGMILHLMDKHADKRHAGENDEQFARRIYKGIVSHAATVNNVYTLSNKGEITAANALGRNVEGLQILDPNISDVPLTVDEWIGKWEVEGYFGKQKLKEDIKAALLSPNLEPVKDGSSAGSFVEIRGLNAKGALAGGLEMVIHDRSGDSYTVTVADKTQAKRRFEGIGNLSDLVASGDDTIVKERSLPRAGQMTSSTGVIFRPTKEEARLIYTNDASGNNFIPKLEITYTDGVHKVSAEFPISIVGEEVKKEIEKMQMYGEEMGRATAGQYQQRTTYHP